MHGKFADEMGKEEIREYLRELGRRGAKATNSKLTPQQRKESARKAAETRWDKQRQQVEDSLVKLKRIGSDLREERKELRKMRKAGERRLKQFQSKVAK